MNSFYITKGIILSDINFVMKDLSFLFKEGSLFGLERLKILQIS